MKSYHLIALLIIIIYMYKNRIEFFGNHKTNCAKLPQVIQYVLDKKNSMRNDKEWEYFIPCGYTSCESDIMQFTNVRNKKIFIIDGCDSLASKITLWRLLKSMYGEDNNIMPRTFILNDDIDEFTKYYFMKKKENSKSKFILKNYKQRQEGLKLSDDIEEILKAKEEGFVLVQDFLENPYIISGHKVNLRYYLLIVCNNGQIEGYIHKDGFVYYTPKPYKRYSMDFLETITSGYVDRKIYENNPLTLEDFRIHIGQKRMKFSRNVYSLLNKTIKALSSNICSKVNNNTKFQLFGADIAPDENLECTLMEINKGPDLGFKDFRDESIKKKVVYDIFSLVEGDEDNDFIKVY